MVQRIFPHIPRSGFHLHPDRSRLHVLRSVTSCALFIVCVCFATGQVITIDTSGKGNQATLSGTPVDHQYQQIEPTHVDLPAAPMDEKSRLEVLRVMQAEQGFAMRPFPKGHKGLLLNANGNLEPAGEAYVNMATSEGVSVRPGGRVVVTDLRIDHNKIIFELNGGPDPKHRFLRHVEIGTDPNYTNPVVADGVSATGARLTLTFKDRVPVVTGPQIKALLAPLISFDVKTPVQAYTDTLPKTLKEAILDHDVLVGMNTDMVMFAKGQPQNKMREMDGQMPIEIWLYGAPPQDVTFVRINGNRVIRVEIAKVGKPVQVFDQDVVTAMLQSDGRQQPVQEAKNVKVVKEGDVQRDPEKQAPAPPPTLAAPGEKLPDASAQNPAGTMKPVHFPKQQPDDSPVAHQGTQSSTQPQPAAQTPPQPGANPDDQEQPEK